MSPKAVRNCTNVPARTDEMQKNSATKKQTVRQFDISMKINAVRKNSSASLHFLIQQTSKLKFAAQQAVVGAHPQFSARRGPRPAFAAGTFHHQRARCDVP